MSARTHLATRKTEEQKTVWPWCRILATTQPLTHHQRGKIAKCTQTHFLTPRRTITRAKMTTAFYDGAGKAFHVVSPDKNDEVSICSTSATTVRMSNRRNKSPSNVVCEVFSAAIFLEFAHPHITVGSAVALAQLYSTAIVSRAVQRYQAGPHDAVALLVRLLQRSGSSMSRSARTDSKYDTVVHLRGVEACPGLRSHHPTLQTAPSL
jgi:hypothetical protein